MCPRSSICGAWFSLKYAAVVTAGQVFLGLLPLFIIYYHLELLDTRWGLILTYTVFGLPLTVFLMSGYFKVLPREVLEAAIVDGASIYQVFFRVALPMVMNAIRGRMVFQSTHLKMSERMLICLPPTI